MVPSHHSSMTEWFPHTVQSRNGSRKFLPDLLKVSVHHHEKNGTITPFLDEAMVSSHHRLLKWFLKTRSRVCVTIERRAVPSHHYLTRQWFPHTVHSPNGSQKLFLGLLRVLGNHHNKNGSLTPFLDEAMVSPYHALSKWFPKTLPGTAKSVWEPS
jgi:hypothetical protein